MATTLGDDRKLHEGAPKLQWEREAHTEGGPGRAPRRVEGRHAKSDLYVVKLSAAAALKVAASATTRTARARPSMERARATLEDTPRRRGLR